MLISLSIGVFVGLLPFAIWYFIVKSSKFIRRNKSSGKRIALFFMLMLKYLLLGFLLYYIVRLPWLDRNAFIVGLIAVPVLMCIIIIIRNKLIKQTV